MKILTAGNPKPLQHTTQCSNCGCKFQFNEDEVSSVLFDRPNKALQIPPPKRRVFVLTCPQPGCEATLHINAP